MRFSSFIYLVGQGLHNMRANRLMTFASMGVLTVCMLLIGTAFLLGVNIDYMVDYLGDQNFVVAYLEQGTTEEERAQVEASLGGMAGVGGITYNSPEDVLQEYSGMLSQYTNLESVFANDNPFLANYEVTLTDVGQMEAVVAQLGALPHILRVNAPLAVQQLFLSLQKVITYGSYGLVAVLGLVSMVVINNTIRITVFARRREIGIMKLVGATNGFIRFPFFVEGTASGLLSAVLASGIVCGGYYYLCQWYAEHPTNLTEMFGGELVPLSQVWYLIVGTFVVFGFVLCGIGTATSIRKHLNV